MNKLRFHYLSATPAVTDTTCNNEQELYEPPSRNVQKSNFWVEKASLHNLEVFIEKLEHIIFQRSNCNKNVFHNITKSE